MATVGIVKGAAHCPSRDGTAEARARRARTPGRAVEPADAPARPRVAGERALAGVLGRVGRPEHAGLDRPQPGLGEPAGPTVRGGVGLGARRGGGCHERAGEQEGQDARAGSREHWGTVPSQAGSAQGTARAARS